MTQPLRDNATRRASPWAVPLADLEQTLREAAAGDAAAWRLLVESYSGRVFGLLYRQTGDRELAEEITQATFVKLVARLADFAGYQEQGRFEPWVLRIAMNGLRDEMRRRKRQATPMDMSPSAGSGRDDDDSAWAAAQQQVIRGGPAKGEDPAELASRAEQLARLRQAVEALGEADQRVLHLRHTAGLSFAQIAETLDQPLGTVLARAHRALAKLRKLMEEPLNAETDKTGAKTHKTSAGSKRVAADRAAKNETASMRP